MLSSDHLQRAADALDRYAERMQRFLAKSSGGGVVSLRGAVEISGFTYDQLRGFVERGELETLPVPELKGSALPPGHYCRVDDLRRLKPAKMGRPRKKT